MTNGLRTLVVDSFTPENQRKLAESDLLDCRFAPGISDEELAWALHGVQVLILRGGRSISARHIMAAPQLRYILVTATAPDKVDLRAAAIKGIEVICAPGISFRATAELAIGNTITLLRQVYQANQTMKSGIWNRKNLVGESLAGKTALIIGYGNMGQKIANFLSVFGVETMAWGHRTAGHESAAWIDNLDEGIKAADLIYVSIASNDETRGLINADRIAMMKPTATLINVSRGEIVDEKALYEALKERRISGAVIDVWQTEPKYNFPLAGLDNVIATPHLGGNTADVQAQMLAKIIGLLRKKLEFTLDEHAHGRVGS